MTSLQELRGTAHIQAELAEVAQIVERLETAPSQTDPAETEPSAPRGWPPTIRFSDKGPLREAFTEMMRRAGLPEVEPIGAEALQERILKSGVKPEERLFSRGIIEMREE